MKFKASIFLIPFVLLLWAYYPHKTNQAALKTKSQWLSQLEMFQNGLLQLQQQVANNHKVTPQEFMTLKKQFKSAEGLISYYYPTYHKSLNGAPLNSVFTDVVIAEFEPPSGLQVIETLLFESDEIDQKETLKQIQKTIQTTTKLQLAVEELVINDRQIFEAARQNFMRIATMGVTGFDAPVLGNSLPTVGVSLQASVDQLLYYQTYAENQNLFPVKDIETLNNRGQVYLQNNTDFDAFDRAYFIKEFIDPLYDQTLAMQQALNIETIDLVSTRPRHTNYAATSIFSADLLNPYAYNKVGEEQPNSKLAEIGKLLFFDPMLSANNKRACASCHKPELAFTDGYATSINFEQNGFLRRNSPTVINAATQEAFFWDGRSSNLNDQIDHVVLTPQEFNSNLDEVIAKLRANHAYVELFSEAYGRDIPANKIGSSDIKSAMSQYIKTLTSYNSPFDKYMRGEDAITAEVVDGFNLFMGKAACATCHFPPTFTGLVPPTFTDTEFEVIGAAQTAENKKWDTDLGRYEKFPFPFYKGSFKTATVRNIDLTAPYMHNGAYQTLSEVVDFYNNGGGVGHGFNIPHQTLPTDSLNLSNQEKEALIAFMESLTDTTGLTSVPVSLPQFPGNDSLNTRKVGGEY